MDGTGLTLLAQDEAAGMAALFAGGLFGCICYLAIFAGVGALMFWGIFQKAGKTPWHSMIPIWNWMVLCEIAGKPSWWGICFLVPILGFVLMILMCLDLVKKFGQGAGFAVGLILLGIVFFPILGFGSAQYNKSAA
jgi:hypothetical protein